MSHPSDSPKLLFLFIFSALHAGEILFVDCVGIVVVCNGGLYPNKNRTESRKSDVCLMMVRSGGAEGR